MALQHLIARLSSRESNYELTTHGKQLEALVEDACTHGFSEKIRMQMIERIEKYGELDRGFIPYHITALHTACRHFQKEVISFLLAFQPNPLVRDASGNTAFESMKLITTGTCVEMDCIRLVENYISAQNAHICELVFPRDASEGAQQENISYDADIEICCMDFDKTLEH